MLQFIKNNCNYDITSGVSASYLSLCYKTYYADFMIITLHLIAN